MANTPDRWQALREFLTGNPRVATRVLKWGMEDTRELLAERDTLAAENKALVEALTWYADESHYGTRVCNDGDGHFDVMESNAEEDAGKKARDCLARVRE